MVFDELVTPCMFKSCVDLSGFTGFGSHMDNIELYT